MKYVPKVVDTENDVTAQWGDDKALLDVAATEAVYLILNSCL